MKTPMTQLQKRMATLALVVAALAVLFPHEVAAQADQLGQQRLGRAYWHVFASYAVGWALVAGWVWSIFRRLKRAEERLQHLDAES